MKKLKKILAVSTAVFVLSLSLSLPTDCVSAANSNNAVSYTVLSLVTTHEWLTFQKVVW